MTSYIVELKQKITEALQFWLLEIAFLFDFTLQLLPIALQNIMIITFKTNFKLRFLSEDFFPSTRSC